MLRLIVPHQQMSVKVRDATDAAAEGQRAGHGELCNNDEVNDQLLPSVAQMGAQIMS